MDGPEDAAAAVGGTDAARVSLAAGDPRTYDYSAPSLACDVVMKGGITSGVVYPHALCELARVYRLRNVGGTSAGAIAAAAAAAAEYGRSTGGFAKLAALPDWIGADENLFDLFQPQPATEPYFRVFTAGLGRKGIGRWLRSFRAALRSFPVAALLGLVPGVTFAVLAILLGTGLLAVTVSAVGIVLALLGLGLALGVRVVLGLPSALAGNLFGLCTGLPSARGEALTPWLADLIDDLAGKQDGSPLTFGELRAHGIELAMTTTNLTQRRPRRLPWRHREFFFDPDELGRLFPARIVAWLEAHPPPAEGTTRERERRRRLLEALEPLRPFPAPDDLPVVVAARMSLSFPFLISAVPLRALDRTRRETRRAVEAVEQGETPPRPPVAETNWFSDGGITSNFPVHFFDAPLPTRPTFAIDLDGFHPDHPRRPDEAANIYLPNGNVGGLFDTWHRLDRRSGWASVVGFAGAIVRTMQNHADAGLTHQPGYRDRIVHVHAAPEEGGMNLTMPPEVIEALTRRGQAAGRKLVERFAETPGEAPGLSWDNHRWVRYRSTLAAVVELLEELGQAWDAPASGERSYRELAERSNDIGPNGYRFSSAAQRELAVLLTELLAEIGRTAGESEADVGDGAPRPAPVARVVPPS